MWCSVPSCLSKAASTLTQPTVTKEEGRLLWFISLGCKAGVRESCQELSRGWEGSDWEGHLLALPSEKQVTAVCAFSTN